MRLKEDRGAERPRPKPAYNAQVGTEGQLIVGFSVHDQAKVKTEWGLVSIAHNLKKLAGPHRRPFFSSYSSLQIIVLMRTAVAAFCANLLLADPCDSPPCASGKIRFQDW